MAEFFSFLVFFSIFQIQFESRSQNSNPYNDFYKCLAKTGADLSYPSNTTWWYDSQGVSVPFLRHPLAVAYVTSTTQVHQLVQCAVKCKIKPVPRSGGHSVEAFSSADGQLVVDISRINFINVQAESRTALVGAGIRLGKLYYELAKHNLAFPAGNCPTVGLGGHVATGGFGDLTRAWGLAADNVLEIEFVDWCGNVLIANAEKYSDLFWALRGGGGGSYGIVTKMKLALHLYPKMSTAFSLSWQTFPSTGEFVRTWFSWKPWTLPKEFKATVILGTKELTGFYIGDDGEAGVTKILKESGLLSIGVSPVLRLFSSKDHLRARAWLFNKEKHYGNIQDYQVFNTAPFALKSFNLNSVPNPVYPPLEPIQNISTVNETHAGSVFAIGPIPSVESSLTDHDYFKYTSQIITKPIDEIGIEAMDYFLNHGGLSLWEPLGGVFDTTAENFNAFPHRKALLNVQHMSPYFNPGTHLPSGQSGQLALYENLTKALEVFTNHNSYSGYSDLLWSTNPTNYMPRYFGSNVDRLIQVKNKYDPFNWFSNAQSTPLTL